MEDVKQKLSAIELDEKVIDSVCKNKKVSAKLCHIVELAGGKSTKPQGNLLYKLSAVLPPSQDDYVQAFVDCIMANKWTRVIQLEEAVAWLTTQLKDQGKEYKIDKAGFEEASGVGVNLTDADIQKLIDDCFKENDAEIKEKGWTFNFNKIRTAIKEK